MKLHCFLKDLKVLALPVSLKLVSCAATYQGALVGKIWRTGALAIVGLYYLFKVTWYDVDDASVLFGISSCVTAPLALPIDQIW